MTVVCIRGKMVVCVCDMHDVSVQYMRPVAAASLEAPVLANSSNPPNREEVTSPTKSTRGWRPLVSRHRPQKGPDEGPADPRSSRTSGGRLLLRWHSALRRFYFVAPDTDCGLWVRAAAPGDRIRFQFRFFLVYSLTPASLAPPAPNASFPALADPCVPGSYLQFYEGPPGAPRPRGPLSAA
ncbi:Low-Density Lipoprotein Receptor Class A Domain-Containing Protein 2 [Manis pentadactyla]|nr:Low-Density Lipoprotein Receptor Class A Domain-Containing Protein 2 [Manis pentadactyla]